VYVEQTQAEIADSSKKLAVVFGEGDGQRKISLVDKKQKYALTERQLSVKHCRTGEVVQILCHLLTASCTSRLKDGVPERPPECVSATCACERVRRV
jgi:hypothetical protein